MFGRARAADPELERRPAVRAARVTGEVAPDAALLVGRAGERLAQVRIRLRRALHRSTPPTASSRAIAATRCGHVT